MSKRALNTRQAAAYLRLSFRTLNRYRVSMRYNCNPAKGMIGLWLGFGPLASEHQSASSP